MEQCQIVGVSLQGHLLHRHLPTLSFAPITQPVRQALGQRHASAAHAQQLEVVLAQGDDPARHIVQEPSEPLLVGDPETLLLTHPSDPSERCSSCPSSSTTDTVTSSPSRTLWVTTQ